MNNVGVGLEDNLTVRTANLSTKPALEMGEMGNNSSITYYPTPNPQTLTYDN